MDAVYFFLLLMNATTPAAVKVRPTATAGTVVVSPVFGVPEVFFVAGALLAEPLSVLPLSPLSLPPVTMLPFSSMVTVTVKESKRSPIPAPHCPWLVLTFGSSLEENVPVVPVIVIVPGFASFTKNPPTK